MQQTPAYSLVQLQTLNRFRTVQRKKHIFLAPIYRYQMRLCDKMCKILIHFKYYLKLISKKEYTPLPLSISRLSRINQTQNCQKIHLDFTINGDYHNSKKVGSDRLDRQIVLRSLNISIYPSISGLFLPSFSLFSFIEVQL